MRLLPISFQAAVEGPLDEAILRRLIESAGGTLERVYGLKGKALLRERIRSYNAAAKRAPWVVLVDLDDDAVCAPDFVSLWLPDPAPLMRLRVAVREIEAWLLADRERIADFLGIAFGRVPADPDHLPDPKRTLVDLARRSRRRRIRESLVPRPDSGRAVGPAYSSILVEFATNTWRPGQAARASMSLMRCQASLRDLVESVGQAGRGIS